jgi:hypothetical protein
MKVDSNIASAINKYISDSGKPAKDFAAKLGISEAALIKWRKKGNGITEPKWQILFSYIKKYLPADSIYVDDAGKEQYASTLDDIPEKYLDPKYIPAMLPVINLETASQYPGMLDAFDKFAKNMSNEKVEFHAKKAIPGGMLAIKMDTKDWLPSLPENATVFIAGKDYPQDGDMVFLKTVDEQVIFAIYNDKGKSIVLNTIPNSQNLKAKLEFKKTQARQTLLWIYPVVSYEVNLRF